MKKRLLITATVAVVGFGSAFFGDAVHAETIQDLQVKQSKIANERETIKANLTKAEAEIADIIIDLTEINEELVQVEEALKENERVMAETQEEKAQLEEEVAQLEADIEERYNILKQRMTSYQKSGGEISFLEVLFDAKSFGEFISRVTYVTKIANSDTDLMNRIEEAKQELEVKVAELAEKELDLKGMEILIKEQKEKAEATKKEIEAKEKELKQLVAELETKDSELALLESQIKRDIQAARHAVAVTQMSKNSSKVTAKANQSKGSVKPTYTAGSGSINTVIQAGYPHLGTPYRWGGKTPSGFDCSGFVSWAYAQAGISIPSSTSGLASTGTKVSYSNAKPGDLIFFDTYKKNGHVGIYLGNGQFIGAQNSTGLAVASLNNPYWSKTFKGHVRRVIQ